MRCAAFATTLLVALTPQAMAAADVAISCTLTHEDTVITSPVAAPEGALIQKTIARIENFTITDTALITTKASPCDKIAGDITSAHANVSCDFDPALAGPASVKIYIDRQMGTISETFAVQTVPGSRAVSYANGTCSKRQSF